MSLDIYGLSTTVSVSATGTHPNLGFVFHSNLRTPTIQDCTHDIPVTNIEHWRSRFRHATIRAINGEMIDTIAQLQTQIREIRNNRAPHCSITIAYEDIGNLHTTQGLPQMHFDQLQTVAHHLNCIKYGDDYNLYEDQDEDAIVMKAIAEGIIPRKFTRRVLKQRDDWHTWEQSEWKQLSSYQKQTCSGILFRNLVPKKDKQGKLKNPTVLQFVWTYLFKNGTTPKSRGTFNGKKRYGSAVTLAQTYASCVEQPASRKFWILAALNGMTVIGANAGNAFAEADPSEDLIFTSIGDQYQRWWCRCWSGKPL